MHKKNKEPSQIPVLQPLRAANEDFSGAIAGRAVNSGWNARDIWRTRIKAERDALRR